MLELSLTSSWSERGEPGRDQRCAQGATTKLAEALNVHPRELVAKDDDEI
jgi:hypothetical protein